MTTIDYFLLITVGTFILSMIVITVELRAMILSWIADFKLWKKKRKQEKEKNENNRGKEM